MGNKKYGGENSVQYKDMLIGHLVKIGVEISAEKDIDRLFQKILEACMNVTCSDAGSLYFKEVDGDNVHLRFQYTKNRSKSFPFRSFVLPINEKSIAGACAYSGKTYNLACMDETIEKIGIKHDDSFDQKIGYKTCNMLVIPMKNYKNTVIGVLQLINKKKNIDDILIPPYKIEEKITPYTEEEARVIESLAAQAAILIERAQLFEGIEILLKSFTKTLVTALDQRDTITAGHSKRVTKYAMNLAKAINKMESGPYKDVCFTPHQLKELYYAGLLHDVGKIGVREFVLMKRNKLEDAQMEAVDYRLRWISSELKTKNLLEKISEDEKNVMNQIENWFSKLSEINRSGFLSKENREFLEMLKKESVTINGKKIEILNAKELESLSVSKGNLTEEERKMIQSHALHSLEILSGIEWTEDLKDVPKIAGAHHEFLDGSGYPYGLSESCILLQSKILTVADIFDALTARDRPYKPAIPIERSLEILLEEVKNNHLDKDLVDLFIKHDLYKLKKREEEI